MPIDIDLEIALALKEEEMNNNPSKYKKELERYKNAKVNAGNEKKRWFKWIYAKKENCLITPLIHDYQECSDGLRN